MAKTLRITEEFVVESKVAPQNKTAISLAESSSNGMVLIPKIEAIHAGATKNKVKYIAQKLAGDVNLRSGVYSWTHPYPKPVLKNHDTDVEPLGRVTNAQFITDSVTGRNAILIMPTITDQDAIQKILDGRYLTVSIGAETDSAVCNICGTDVVQEGWCEHQKGQMYEKDGQLMECVWEAGNLWFHEVSFVNVPADQNAQVVATGEIMMMECFMSDGKEVYNLQASAESKGFKLTQEAAVLEGVITPDSNKGGTGALKTLEELQAELEQVNGKLTESATQLTEKDTEIATLTEKVQSLEESKKQLEETKAQLEEAGTQLQTQVTELTEQAQTLESKATAAEAENQRLLDENANMAAEIHKALAERVVDLKCALRKPGSEDQEAMLADHVERSAESLKDSLVDLLKEFKIAPSSLFVADKVTNPALADETKQPGAVDVKPLEEEQKDKPKLEDVFKFLLTKNNNK